MQNKTKVTITSEVKSSVSRRPQFDKHLFQQIMMLLFHILGIFSVLAALPNATSTANIVDQPKLTSNFFDLQA